MLIPEAILLDTMIVSVFLKISPNEARRDAIESFVSGKIAMISFVTVAELLFWAASNKWGDKRRIDLDQRLRAYGILDPTLSTCEQWAAKKQECKAAGVTIGQHDMWIAAAALEHDLTVVTSDKIFEKIAGLKVHKI